MLSQSSLHLLKKLFTLTVASRAPVHAETTWMLGGLPPLVKNTVPEHIFRAIVRSLVVFEKAFLSQDEIEKTYK